MIVVDASAMVEALVGRDPDAALLEVVAGDLAAPHLLDVEVLSALGGLVLGEKLAPELAERAVRDHFAFDIARQDVSPLASRVWGLRHRYSSYDACYLALAEALDAPLYTCDARLAGPGHEARVEVVKPTR